MAAIQSKSMARLIRQTANAVTVVAAVAMASFSTAASAEDADGPKDGIPSPSIATSLPGNGDPGGIRKHLADRGFTFGLNYIGEVWRTASGGVKRAGDYNDRFELVIDADLGKIMGLKGLAFHANGYQIDSDRFSTRAVGTLSPISGIEARDNTRLYEIWLEQSFEPANVSVRFGQLAADSEFLLSTFSGQFVNATFGWPDVTAADMTSGGPAYPLATPGVRVKWEPSKRITLLAALFNGDPAGKSDPDPQLANRHGTNFRTGDPALLMVEGQYKLNGEKTDKGLATTAKLGTWAHFGSFNDLRYDSTGTPIAQSNATGAVLHRDWGVYGVLDQQLWRPAGAGPDQGIGFFTRTAFAPSDRNLIDFYLDGGIVFAGLIARRPDDSFGLALAYDKISDRARGLDQDNVALGNIQPIRSQQVTLEAFYKAQVVPGFTVQPDFQYIWHPGGGAADPNNGARAIPDATVVGVRTTINY